MFNRRQMMQAAGNAGGPVEIALTISGDTHNYNIFANRGSEYEAGNSIITLTINSGIYVGSTSTGTPGLTIPTDFDAGDQINIINNGFIVGAGGNGGAGGQTSGHQVGLSGGAGGPAILASRAVTITNNGTVGGGGGGGGGGGYKQYCTSYYGSFCTGYGVSNGGAGGGGAGYNAGSGGSKTSGGGGGSSSGNGSGGNGGSGGGLGSAGSSGAASSSYGGGAGGAAGNYANGNSNITWATTGTRVGGVS